MVLPYFRASQDTSSCLRYFTSFSYIPNTREVNLDLGCILATFSRSLRPPLCSKSPSLQGFRFLPILDHSGMLRSLDQFRNQVFSMCRNSLILCWSYMMLARAVLIITSKSSTPLFILLTNYFSKSLQMDGPYFSLPFQSLRCSVGGLRLGSKTGVT